MYQEEGCTRLVRGRFPERGGGVVARNPWPVRYPRYILSDGRLRRIASKKPDVSIDFP